VRQEIEKPYMYLNHYSTPGIVFYYLIRKYPAYILRLQNGGFGPRDRMFFNIEKTFEYTLNVVGDVKELIPEFFFGSGDFLTNTWGVQLGKDNMNKSVGDVSIPPWADTVQDFILKNRKALESNFVSAQLHYWIDLVFGFKQQGDEALYSYNLFNS